MFILINKPKGWTSFDVVGYIRSHIRKSGLSVIRKLKVGHAGTLDPFATGLLIVGVGREATRRLDEFKNLPKTYVATIKLGAVSDTFDCTGKITKIQDTRYKQIQNYKFQISNFLHKIFPNLSIFQSFNLSLPEAKQMKIIQNVLSKFIGKQHQLPPMYSAKKINGQKLYELARQGITVKRKKCKIEIYNIKLIEYNYPTLKIEVSCSAGTYIRTLANDIGEKLRVGAYCDELERTRIGEYKLEDAKTPYDCHVEFISASFR